MADLKFLILYPAIFGTASFLFSFLSWGHATLKPPQIVGHEMSILTHLVEHAALGALVALPTRRKIAILACALAAMLMDVDHISSIVGLPTDGRASHAVSFGVAIFFINFLLARKGIFGSQIRPLFIGSLSLASFMVHLAWDSIDGAGADFPLLMPFSNTPIFVPSFGGVLLAITAAAMLWATVAMQQCNTQPKHNQTES